MLGSALFLFFVVVPIFLAVVGDASLLTSELIIIGSVALVILFLWLLVQQWFWAIVAAVVAVALSVAIVYSLKRKWLNEQKLEIRDEPSNVPSDDALFGQPTDSFSQQIPASSSMKQDGMPKTKRDSPEYGSARKTVMARLAAAGNELAKQKAP